MIKVNVNMTTAILLLYYYYYCYTVVCIFYKINILYFQKYISILKFILHLFIFLNLVTNLNTHECDEEFLFIFSSYFFKANFQMAILTLIHIFNIGVWLPCYDAVMSVRYVISMVALSWLQLVDCRDTLFFGLIFSW